MKISYRLLSHFVQPLPAAEEVAAVLTRSGLEVEGMEEVEKIPGGLKGVVVGHVLECAKHPDADRLSITKVDLGNGEPVQIVCGAPNVAAGQKVLVATVGTTLFPSSGESFTIKKSKIRGAESIGMICAEDELGLGQSHDGILILPEETAVGTPAAVALAIDSDLCIEIGITPNRTDALSHFGVARDFVAAWNTDEANTPCNLVQPNLAALNANAGDWKIKLNEDTQCVRYQLAAVQGLANVETPQWMKDVLTVIGVKTVNFAVDLTNYIQHELGQPMHVFRASDFASQTVHIRLAAGEKLTTLDQVERELNAEDVVIASDSEVLCLGGVMGGAKAGVTAADDAVVFESACFNPVKVRKTAKRHGIHSDSSFRFERGTAVDMVPVAMARAWQIITEVAPQAVLVAVKEEYPTVISKTELEVEATYLEKLLGIVIPKVAVTAILQRLEFEVTETTSGWKVRVPFNRVEVTRPADVAEEVLRIYGYDRVELPSRMKLSLNAQGKSESLHYRIADHLAAEGFAEIMSMSLVKSAYAEKFDEVFQVKSVSLLNPLSKDLSHMRSSLVFGVLEAVALNEKHRSPDVRFFEIGKTYQRTENGYRERRKLAIAVAGKAHPESWNTNTQEVSLVELRGVVEKLLSALGAGNISWNERAEDGQVHYGLEGVYQNKVIVKLGRVHSALLAAADVQQEVFYAEMEFDQLEKLQAQQKNGFSALNKYPWVRRDLSLLLNKEIKFESLRQTALKAERKLLKEVGLFDVYEGKNLPDGKKSYAVKFILQDENQTLTDEVVEKSMQRILQSLQKECAVELR